MFLLLLSQSLVHGSEKSPAGGRAASMAGISVTAIDLWSTVNNPSGLAWISRISGGFVYDNQFRLAGLSRQTASLSLPFRWGTTGYSVSHYGNSLYREMQAGFSVARRFGNRFGMGIRFGYESIALGNGYGRKDLITGRIGLLFRSDRQLSIGLLLVNPVPIRLIENPVEYLPVHVNVGLSWQAHPFFQISFELEKDLNHPPVFRSGFEYSPLKNVYTRAGFSLHPVTITFGAGIAFRRWNFDIGSGLLDQTGFRHMISLIYQFGK